VSLFSRFFLWLRDRIARPVTTDLLWLFGAILCLNLLFASKDPGWLAINPSPYFVIPLLIGMMHGSVAGALSGFIVAGLLMAWSWTLATTAMEPRFVEWLYFAIPSVLCGFICGEGSQILRRRIAQLEVLDKHMRDRMQKLDKEVFLLKEAKDELDRIVASYHTDIATLDSEMRRLSQSRPADLFPNFLLLLNRRCRITDAAIYTLRGDTTLKRESLIGVDKHLPPSLNQNEIEIIRLALERKNFVAVVDVWNENIDTQEPHLFAIPLVDWEQRSFACLVVTGMSFIAFREETVRMVELLCRWASEIFSVLGEANRVYRLLDNHPNWRVFSTDFFQNVLQTAIHTNRNYDLESALVIFEMPGKAPELQVELERVILPMLRTGDFPAPLDSSFPNLVVLLPMTGERGAAIFVQRITEYFRKLEGIEKNIRSKVLKIEKISSYEDLLNIVRQGGGKAS